VFIESCPRRGHRTFGCVLQPSEDDRNPRIMRIARISLSVLMSLIVSAQAFSQSTVVELQPYVGRARTPVQKPYIKVGKPKVTLLVQQERDENSRPVTTVTLSTGCKELVFTTRGKMAVGKVYFFLRFRSKSSNFDRFIDGTKSIEIKQPILDHYTECQTVKISTSARLPPDRYLVEAILRDIESGGTCRKKRKLTVTNYHGKGDQLLP
jgi:hypothetical protein